MVKNLGLFSLWSIVLLDYCPLPFQLYEYNIFNLLLVLYQLSLFSGTIRPCSGSGSSTSSTRYPTPWNKDWRSISSTHGPTLTALTWIWSSRASLIVFRPTSVSTSIETCSTTAPPSKEPRPVVSGKPKYVRNK